MAQYIDKSAIVAELERLKECNRKICGGDFDFLKKAYPKHYYSTEIYNDILSYLDTLEVKEVDLEEKLKSLIEKEKAFVTDNREVKYYNGDSFNHIYELEFIAKHFFELGLKKHLE